MSTFVPSSHMGDRLKEERERLGLTQTEFAAIANVGRKTQFNYESGKRSPDTVYLDAVSKAGVDCAYVLSGQRSPPASQVRASGLSRFPRIGKQPSHAEETTFLTSDEAELLIFYRLSHPAVRRSVKAALRESLSDEGDELVPASTRRKTS